LFVFGMLFSFCFQIAVVLLTIVHLAIDWCKFTAAKRHAAADGALAFTIDQLVHAVTVFFTACWIVRAPPAHEMIRVLGILRRPDNKILLAMVV
jgi:cbb3-type cytochrome oxidase subunit 3